VFARLFGNIGVILSIFRFGQVRTRSGACSFLQRLPFVTEEPCGQSVLRFDGIGKNRKDARITKMLGNKELEKKSVYA
jgi:hypothetical protein